MKKIYSNKILIAPHSPISERLAKYLNKFLNVEIIGYIDNSKIGKNIYKKEDVAQLDFDKLLIFSPNHFNAIYKTLRQYVSIYDIYKVDIIDKDYMYLNFFEILKDNIKVSLIDNYTKSKKLFLKYLSATIDKLEIKRELSVFIAEDYVDANIKHLFLYYIKNNMNTILLTNNIKQKEEFQKYNLPVSLLFSWQGYFYTAIAKKVYLDHFILDYMEYLSPSQITVQLWHGVGLKPIQDRSKFHYNYFISTSNWTNETNFKSVFKADDFLNLGYPRNDILLKESEDKLDLILCDMDIYNGIQENRKNNLKSILYMPTFRENGFESFPISFLSLNENMRKLNIKFYVKLHPYVLNQYRDSIKEENFSNIIFYNTQGDIYPILKYIDILITDYSSIAYDFLFLDRPIIFFDYDYDEYIKARENGIGYKFLFDYYDYTPGKKVQTQEELEKEIKDLLQDNDDYKNDRIKIRDKFFDNVNSKNCNHIIKEL